MALSCNNVSIPKDSKKDSITSWQHLNPECEMYAPYIEYARYLVYLKMAAQPVTSEVPPYALKDSLYYGMYNLKFLRCQEKHGGLWLDFHFMNGNKPVLMLGNLAQKNEYTCSVYFRNNSLRDYFFVFGDLSLVFLDKLKKIDTPRLVKYYNSGKFLNEWFKKKFEDSILNKKIKSLSDLVGK